MSRLTQPFLSVLWVLVVCSGGSIAMSQEAPAPAPPPPATVDLRVEGDPLLVLFERIARDLECGLIAHRSVVDVLSQEAHIEVADARWSDAVALFATEYGIAVRRTADRLELTQIDAEFRRLLVRRSYPIGHLIEVISDHKAPMLGFGSLYRGEGGGGALLSLGGGEESVLLDSIPDMIPEIAGRGTWDREGVSLEIEGDRLMVRQIPAVHEAIAVFLKDIEQRIARQVICRFTPLPPGEYGETLTAEELAPLVEGRIPRATWVAADGQTNHWFAGEERTFIEDVEFVSHIADPVVELLRTGWAIEVTPHVTQVGVVANVSLVRATSPGSEQRDVLSSDGETWVSIESPKLEFDQSLGTFRVPDGGASIHQIGGGFYALEFEVLDPRRW